MMQLGVGALLISEEHGGAALGLENTALAFEVLGQCATPGPFLGHALAGWALTQSGDDRLKNKWLRQLASGEAVATVGFDRWTPDEWQLKVNAGKLSGELELVAGADQAKLLVIGVAGGLAVVEVGPGVEVIQLASSDMTRRISRVIFTEASATMIGSNALGARLIDAALVLVAADALGGAQQCLSMTVEYAKQREQFGVVIGSFQAMKHQMANMALEVESARALVWYAAYAWDQQLPDASLVAAHAKAHLADRFVSVARMSVQAHGGIGYTWDYDLQIWFRRSLFDRAYLGAPSLHRERAAVMAGW